MLKLKKNSHLYLAKKKLEKNSQATEEKPHLAPRKEHVPSELKKEFRHLVDTLFPYEKKSFFQQKTENEKKAQDFFKEGKTFGITRMYQKLENLDIRDLSDDQIAAQGRFMGKLDTVLEKAKSLGYENEIKGDEVVLAPLGIDLL